MQMIVTHTTYCYFVVCSPSGIYHIVIHKDFIEQKLQQAEKLFWLAVMPGKWYTRKHTELPSHVTYNQMKRKNMMDHGVIVMKSKVEQ